MMSAKSLSDAIRMKRKKVAADGVENMVDTDALPQMNPQDIYNLKHQAQIEQTLDVPEKSSAPSDPADAELGESQEVSQLKKKMAHVERILQGLKIG